MTPHITSDEKKVITAGWKDEGFRINNDVSLDWKEQLNYRIVQLSPTGDAMLYYGCKCFLRCIRVYYNKCACALSMYGFVFLSGLVSQ